MMNHARQIASKLLAIGRQGTSERAMVKEMDAHLAMLEEDFRKIRYKPIS